jgi:sugar/nucleoside kinase (ribokinase family)
MSARYDATCIGNAIVDVITKNEEAFIAKHGLVKGAMTLIDAERAEALYAAMGPGLEASGGSAGNTAAGLASLGGKAAFIGKVTADQLGAVYRHDIRAVGVDFDSKPLDPAVTGTPPTARSLIIVTPDAQRTMNTYLGACVELTPDDVDEAVISGSQVTYLEGYLWDRPTAKEAFIKAAQIAHSAGRKVSLTLSDSFCVERHRDSFLSLIDSHVDLLFANEAEIKALYQVDDFDTAVAALRGRGDHPQREGLGDRDRGRDPPGRGRAAGPAGRHHRCRRPLCLRLPLRLHPRSRPGRERPHRQHRRRRGDQPCRPATVGAAAQPDRLIV